jgi:TonB-linked SusC/RagA family outer membrane protein
MRKLIFLSVFLLLAGIQGVFSQKVVSGKVISPVDNAPLQGVTVVIQGTTTGTITDTDGNYSISVPDDEAILEYSIVGYLTEEVQVGTRINIDVALEEDIQQLGEVVVTALGIKRDEKSLGYAVTSVNTDDLVKNRNTNLMNSLEGRVAGLNITPPAAGAGASTQIRLRGQVAFAGANNSPLIVINGLPLDQNAQSADGRANMRDLGDNINNINPDDIESMTVLKGATAAAIYGSRAANGAIIITTKSGQRNQGVGLEFISSYTSQKPLNYWDLQEVYGQGTGGEKPNSASNASSTGQFGWGARMDGSPVTIFNGQTVPYSPHPDNLFKYLRNGSIWNNSLAFSGGNESGSFRASFTDTRADGIDPYNTYKKRNANLGVNYFITKKVNFSMNVNYTNEIYINPPEIGTQGPGAVNFFTRLSNSIPYEALRDNATDPVTGTESLTSGFQGTILNPIYAYGDAGQRYELTKDRFLGTATLRYNVTSWLFAQGRLNYDYSIRFTEDKIPGGIGTSQPLNTADNSWKGTYSVREDKGTDINADFLIGANKQFNKFTVSANFGGNTFRIRNHFLDQEVTNFVVRDFFSISNGNNQTQIYDLTESRVNSLYGLAEFGYNSMFFINFTARQDWFSVLNPSNNSKFYPSVSGSFVFSELLKNKPWLTYGKLRGSWAQVGSANGVNPYERNLAYAFSSNQVLGVFNTNQFNGQTLAILWGTGALGDGAPNSDLEPFTVTEKEIGLEARLFKNKLLFDIAAFDKVTTDQLLDVQLSDASGFVTSKRNLGSLKNSGIEFMIEFTPVENSNFSWTTSFNNTYLHTEVLSVGQNPDGTEIEDLLLIYFNGTGNEFLGELHYTVGKPMNQLYTRTYLRNENGDILVADNGRLIGTTEVVPWGSSIPKNTGGWTNIFTYKKISLGVFIDYKQGGYVMSSTLLNMTRQGFSQLSLEGRRDGENGLVFPGVYESNGQPNTTAVTDLQGFYADYRNLQIGDPFVFKSDFIKLRNISLSYDFSELMRNAAILGFVEGLTLTASLHNVAILYKDLPNLDPESIQSSGDFRAGYENTSLPTTRDFMFSLNAKF